MSDPSTTGAVDGSQASGTLAGKLALAQQVRRPMTFFALLPILVVPTLLSFYYMTPDDVPVGATITMGLLALTLPVDCVCALLWAKAKLASDPNAFNQE